MHAIQSFLEKYLIPVATKLSQNKYLKAISGGFAFLLPITMIGAIFALLSSLNIGPYQAFITSIGLKPILAFPPTVTTDMIALYAVFGIGKSLTEELGHKEDAFQGAMISLFVFLLLIPLGTSVKVGEEMIKVAGVLSVPQVGTMGLFSAMILGIIVPRIYCFLLDKKITIRLPEQVPPTISKSFSALVPGFILTFIFIFVRYGLSLTTFASFNNLIYSLLRTPLASLSASPLTFMIFIFMGSLLWFFGIHGGMIVMPFLSILYTQAGVENLQALNAGTTLPNILTGSSWSLFASLGGIGGTIGLSVFMCFFAKSQRYRTIGKIALPSNLCGINEPITFGVPIVLNAMLLLPFIITPITTFLISYGLMAIGILPYTNGVAVALGTPVIFSGFIACGWQAALLQVALIGVQFLIYFPFVSILDKQAYLEEQAIPISK